MAWLPLPQLIVYVVGLLGCSMVAWRLMTGWFDADSTRQVGWALCPGALIGGLLITSLAIPDWNPIAILWLFLPYYAFAAWALFFSLLVRRGREPWIAGRRALVWTVPSLLLVPFVVAALVLLLVVR
ncbi:MAG: hypothetical protein P4L93_06565 [Coriobacteriia bacterium]|nr:hypothetical protein [Coriobacteriia bacterium]